MKSLKKLGCPPWHQSWWTTVDHHFFLSGKWIQTNVTAVVAEPIEKSGVLGHWGGHWTMLLNVPETRRQTLYHQSWKMAWLFSDGTDRRRSSKFLKLKFISSFHYTCNQDVTMNGHKHNVNARVPLYTKKVMENVVVNRCNAGYDVMSR